MLFLTGKLIKLRIVVKKGTCGLGVLRLAGVAGQ